MIISICVGSSCHLKGSREIITKLESLIQEHQLKDKVELNGSFCMGNCVKGVCVTVDNTLFSVRPDTTEEFFENEVLRRLT
ncbi:MAG: NAD(P)H-dependent oxidoreductase subunit E [Clostridiales bacterium]|nr:NAD(P)H-dependent oxidoreductase subunit E [Clostridiales bacterium]